VQQVLEQEAEDGEAEEGGLRWLGRQLQQARQVLRVPRAEEIRREEDEGRVGELQVQGVQGGVEEVNERCFKESKVGGSARHVK